MQAPQACPPSDFSQVGFFGEGCCLSVGATLMVLGQVGLLGKEPA